MNRWHQVLIVLSVCFMMQAVSAQSHFTAKFSAAQETHGVTSAATGTASCILSDDGLKINFIHLTPLQDSEPPF